MRPIGYIAAAILSTTMLTGCMLFRHPQPSLSQAQLNAIETRDVDAGFNDTFSAATGALFDAGYTISMSDRQAGLVTGTKSVDRSRQRRFSQDVTIEDTDYAVSILVRKYGPQRSSVRVKTSVNGQPVLDKQSIDQIWHLMQRQVLMTAPLVVEADEARP